MSGTGVVQSYSRFREVLTSPFSVYILIAVAIVFHVLTIRAGHQWEGDFALYVAHARNIATGHPYADTGYLFNPHVPLLSPRVYPPVFPLLVSPVYHFFGLNIFAIKIAGIFVFALFLLVLYHYTRERLSNPALQMVVVAAVAFSPWFWLAKDRISPDFYFIFFAYAAIFVLDRASPQRRLDGRLVLLALVSALMICLAYGTRTLGLLLVPALALSDLLKYRTLRGFTILVTVLFVAFYIGQNSVLHTDQSYLDSYKGAVHQVTSSDVAGPEVAEDNLNQPVFQVAMFLRGIGSRIIENIEYYHQVMSSYWITNINDSLDDILYLVMGLLAIVGFISLVMQGPSIAEFFLVLYVSVLLVVPFLQDRYMLPLIPIYLVYIFQGVEVVATRIGRMAGKFGEWRLFMPLGASFAVTLVYAGAYAASDFGDFQVGVEKDESVEMFDFIRQHTTEESIVVFRAPRVMALYTGRKSTMYYWTDNADELWDYLSGIGATHVVEHKENARLQGSAYLHNWVVHYADRLKLLFENNDFRVFQLQT